MSPGTLRLEVSLNKEVGSCFTDFKLFLFIWINQFVLNIFIPDFKISKNLQKNNPNKYYLKIRLIYKMNREGNDNIKVYELTHNFPTHNTFSSF